MSNDEKQRVSGFFGYKLKQTQHALRLRMDDALRTLSLTTPQYGVLAQLELKPGISNASLARSSFITPQTMHSIISHLEKRHLVKRESDPEHGRILRTELTEEGKRVVREAHGIIRHVEERMMVTLDEEDRSLLEKLLLTCFNNLNTL